MPSLSKNSREKIKSIIESALRKKLMNYNPETKQMPFHYRLIGKDRMALYSFIQSLNTTFGTSLFEPIAETIAREQHADAHRQFVLGNLISESVQIEIQHIINELTTGKGSNKEKEIQIIKNVAQKGRINKLKSVRVDLLVRKHDGSVYLFDLKTAKPNISNFKDFKRTLLEWVAIYLYSNPDANVHSYIAIPYNPYAPKPYERWTLKGMFDLENELLVGEEFWDFLGGKGTYPELLNCFEEIGIKMRPEIDAYFKKFQ